MDFSIFSTKVCEKNLFRAAGKIPDLLWIEILVILCLEYNINHNLLCGHGKCPLVYIIRFANNEPLPGGGYLFPCFPEINWRVPLFPKN